MSFVIAFLAWFAIILDYSISKESTATFFSYFTILSNLLAAISFTATFLPADTLFRRAVTGHSFRSALTVYIVIVGLVYNFVLRDTWSQPVLNFTSNNLLHIVIPVLCLVHWIVFIPGRVLRWHYGLLWLSFPLVFLIYSLVRGLFTQWYPYPFLNVTNLGYSTVLLNALNVTAGFLAVGFLLIAVNLRFRACRK